MLLQCYAPIHFLSWKKCGLAAADAAEKQLARTLLLFVLGLAHANSTRLSRRRSIGRGAVVDRHCLERDAARKNQPVIIGVILRCGDLHSNSNSKAQAAFGIVRQANFAYH